MIKTQTFEEIKELFHLDILVEERITFLKALYPHISFRVKLEKTVIFNDKIGFSKVIDNIVDNAIKYSQKSISINIILENFILSIEDFGCGIDEVELIKIFDNYYQSNQNMKGFGIGLSMVKRFCDKNHILLNINSKVNVGTVVSLKIEKKGIGRC